MKLALPARCHRNPNPLLNTFHIRKVPPCYLKPLYGLYVTTTRKWRISRSLCVQLILLLSYVAINSPLISRAAWKHWMDTLLNVSSINKASIGMTTFKSTNIVNCHGTSFHASLPPLAAHKLLALISCF